MEEQEKELQKELIHTGAEIGRVSAQAESALAAKDAELGPYYREKELLLRKKELLLLGARGSAVGGSAARADSGAPGYSTFLDEKLQLHTAAEQYGFWVTGAGAIAYAGSKLRQAALLAKAAAEPDVNLRKELRMLAAVTEDQLEMAQLHIRKFRTKAVTVAFGAPFLWLVWRWGSGSKRK